jgi:hypothetical protein
MPDEETPAARYRHLARESLGERIRLTASGAAKPAIRAKRHLGTFAFTRALLFRALKFVKSKGGNDETRFDRCR